MPDPFKTQKPNPATLKVLRQARKLLGRLSTKYKIVRKDKLDVLETIARRTKYADKVQLTRNEAAIYVGLAPKTLANLAAGDADPYNAISKNGRVRYRLKDLQKALGIYTERKKSTKRRKRNSG
ncbi:MAG: hypothetical protein N4A65_09295 [Cohaesibacter sp.]|jgi:hypothetical protein|nr:hypothetical protein [Cohaesibacter sp.]